MTDSTAGRLRLTVAVCTWNRAASLARTLEHIAALEIPAEVDWDLLVVNNNCSDDTDAVIESFASRLPIKRVWEPQPGLSNARNRALAEATGKYILWTDDDVSVEKAWLAGYVAAFRRWPEADIFGGAIQPHFEGGPPAWLTGVHGKLGGVFGLQDLGQDPVRLTPEGVRSGPFGGNMAMRVDALRRFSFDPALGVRGGQYIVGEETELIRSMLNSGHEGWWTPEARVRHRIPPSDQTLGQVRRWMIGYGRYKGYLMQLGHQEGRSRIPRFSAFRWMIRHELRFQICRHIRPPEEWIMDLIHASQARGILQASMKHLRSP